MFCIQKITCAAAFGVAPMLLFGCGTQADGSDEQSGGDGSYGMRSYPIKAIVAISDEGKPEPCADGPDANNTCKGFVEFEQTSPKETRVSWEFKGLSPGRKYHFHIHEDSDLSDGCHSAGGHYNPHNKTHGDRLDEEREVGDMGSITADKNGVAQGTYVDDLIKLEGKYNVIGLPVTIELDPYDHAEHEKDADDHEDEDHSEHADIHCGKIERV